MKKSFLVFLLIMVAGFIYIIVDRKTSEDNNQEFFQEEQDFNNGGQSKDILDETSLSNIDLIQGKWTSLEDENSAVEFKDKKTIDYYSDSKMNEGTFELYESDSFTNLDNNGSYLRSIINGDSFDYYIISISEDSLVLSYLPRGNTLNYRK